MKKLGQVIGFICFIPVFAVAQPKDEPVGATRPVYVVNESLRVEGNVTATFDQPLTVEFPTDNPVPVVFQSGAEDRLQASIDVTINAGETSGCTPFMVPSDKRLIINQISGDVLLSASSYERAIVTLHTGPDTGNYMTSTHYVQLTSVGANISDERRTETFIFNEQPNIFHDGNTGAMKVCISRGPRPGFFSLSANGRITISGILKNSH